MRIIPIMSTMLTLCNLMLFSQVTIGSGIEPVRGALLDLKQTNAIASNSSKGFIFPRVYLTSVSQLTDISDVNTSDSNQLLLHTGLTVYNTNASFQGGVGINMWDGAKWVNILQPQLKSNMAVFLDQGSSITLNLAIPIANWRYIALPNKLMDLNSEYNTSTGVYTAKNTGTYNVNFRMSLSGLAILTTYGIAIYKKTAAGTAFSYLTSATKTTLASITALDIQVKSSFSLDAGDQLMFAVQNNALASLTIGSEGMSYLIIYQQ